MQFTKMHGLGNDYVYVNAFKQDIADPEQLAVRISDRHFGVGSDGLILILPSEQADVRMRMFNADGSEAEMCGNGVRCVAKYACEHKLAKPKPLRHVHLEACLQSVLPSADTLGQITVETGRGVLTLGVAVQHHCVEQVCVDMGSPILNPADIPVKVTGTQVVGVPMTAGSEHLLLTAVSMGNPHAVFYCNDVEKVQLERIGPLIENHPLFPQRINVHFVQRLSDTEVAMRTWERGSGITLACGTGAAAVCVAGVLASKTAHDILAHLPGGDLTLSWNEDDGHVYLTGPATEVFTGEWPDSD